MNLRSSLLCCAFLAVLALPGQALAQAPAPALHSDNVSLVTKLPEAAGAASARFSSDGNTMYVSTWKGLLIYDVSAPDNPQRLGFLPLPHFENEDVDVGEGIVIISNDPSEGIGVIYVVDVSDPSLPKIASVTPNGLITASATLGLPSKTGHIANCLQGCKYLWMTGTSQGVVVYEMVDKTPVFKTSFQVPGKNFTHDVFVDRAGIAWVTGGDGTFGYDTADPVNPTLVFRSDEKVVNSGNDGPNSPDTANGYPLDFLHHNSIRTSIQLAQPAPGAPEQTPAQDAPAGQPGGEEQAATAPGATTPATQPASTKPAAKKKARARKRCRTVKVKRKGKTKRVRRCTTVKTRKKRHATVNKYGSRTTLGGLGDVVAVTEEDYTRPTCNGQGSVQTWQITPGETNADGTTKLKLLDMWTTELNELETQTGRSPATVLCSAHWFDEDRGLLAQGWYDQGVRFMDIRDPTNITQVGYWVTSGTFWAAYFAPKDKSIVYGLDIQGGIDVLKIDRGASTRAVRAPVKRSWLNTDGTLKPSSKWGYACPLIASVPGAPDEPKTAQVPLPQ